MAQDIRYDFESISLDSVAPGEQSLDGTSDGFSFTPIADTGSVTISGGPREADNDRSWMDPVKDTGITMLKGVMSVPEALVGLLDIPTAGRIGKQLEDWGYKPGEAKELISELYSEQQKRANRNVEEAEGFWDTVSAMLDNPSTIYHTTLESAPLMIGGASVARGILAKAPKIAAWAAGAIGEGTMGAGSAASEMRQQSEDGRLTGKQSVAALGSGLGTAALGGVGGKLSDAFKLADVDTMLAKGFRGAGKAARAGFLKQIIGSGITEGVFEELPQSVQEQMWQNWATGKPLMENAAKAGAQGMMAGLAMGGAGGGFNATMAKLAGPRDDNDDLPPPDPVAEAAKQPNSPLSRAALAGDDQITQRVREVEGEVRNGDLLQKLRDIDNAGGGAAAEFVEALNVARNINAPAELRQRAMDDIETAMGWINDGAMPSVDATGRPFSTDLTVPSWSDDAGDGPGGPALPGPRALPDSNVIDVDATLVDTQANGTGAEDGAAAGASQSADDIRAEAERWYASAERARAQGDTEAWNARIARARELFAQAEQAAQQAAQAADQATARDAQVAQDDVQDLRTAAEPMTDVQAPRVSTPAGEGTAVSRRRAEQLRVLAADGFTTVERDGNSFYLINPAKRQRVTLDNAMEAQRARHVIRTYVDEQARTAAAHPEGDRADPTEAQIKAGNYKKSDVINVGGMQVRLENPAGSTRSGVDEQGNAWSTQMQHHYGEVQGVIGKDGDKLDAFIGPNPASGKVFVVDQNAPSGRFDEHKVMMGFNSLAEAEAGYRANYDADWQGMGAITEMTVPQFRAWARSDAVKLPAKGYDVDSQEARNVRDVGTVEQAANSRQDRRAGKAPGGVEEDSVLDASGQGGRGDHGAAAEVARDRQRVADLASHINDPSTRLAGRGPEADALRALLHAAKRVFGIHGVAVESDTNEWDGVSYRGVAFVNVLNPWMHVAQTIGHELAHTQERGPQALRNRLWELMSEDGKRAYFEGYWRRGRSYDSITPVEAADLKSEMLADFMGNRFHDRAWLESLAQQRPALFGSFVRDWLRMLDQLISTLRGMAGAMHPDAAKQVDKYVTELEQAKDLAAQIVTQWAERHQGLAKKAGFERADDAQHSRRVETKQAYEKRIDELFADAAPRPQGVRVLDRSDILSLLGLSDGPIHLVEGKVDEGRFNHGLTAKHWKSVPEWLDDPAMVFDSETQPGRLVLIAPELVRGDPVRMIVDPRAEGGVNLLVNAYDAKRNPFERWDRDGLLRYYDRKKAPTVAESFQPRLTGLPGDRGRTNILTEKNLSGWRKANPPQYSLRQKEPPETLAPSGLQSSRVEQEKRGTQPILSKADQAAFDAYLNAIGPQGDMFADDFADQSTITSDGHGNVNSAGNVITSIKQGLENFWRWFGDSVARVPATSSEQNFKDQPPMVMYHTARNGDFSVFESGRPTINGTTLGNVETERHAIFFTPSAEDSAAYGEGAAGRVVDGANMMPVYLKAENPLWLKDGISEDDVRRLADAGMSERHIYGDLGHWSMFDDEDGADTVDLIKKAGYDSVVFSDENPNTGDSFEAWAVFDPEQIKSAIGNTGAFDPSNPDIRYSKRTEPAVEPAPNTQDRNFKLNAERGERVENKVAKLSANEIKAIKDDARKLGLSAKQADAVMDEARRVKTRFPQSDGWAPLEVIGVTHEVDPFTDEPKPGTEQPKFQSIAYGFNVPPGAKKAPPKRDVVWAEKVAKKFESLILDIYDHANNGDKNAQTIISHQTWYRNVAEVLRREYGGFGDLLADLLGATSPNTPVDTNWAFSIDAMRRFVAGDFNGELERLQKWLDDGKSISDFPNADKVRQASGKLYGMNSGGAMLAMLDMWRIIKPGSAPKARNFALNLIGQSNMATIDVWAARMLRRAADMVRGASFPRIPTQAEMGVTGNWNSKATEVTGAFGFGAAVLDLVSKSLAKKGIHIAPPDLQAVAWFAEKELWTRKNWTSVQGEGGSFEERIAETPIDRYVAGFSIQQDVAPSDEAMSLAQARTHAMLTGDNSVLAVRVMPTIGLYGGDPERSFDMEWVVHRGKHDPRMVMAEIARIAGEEKQKDIFVSRVIQPGEVNENARPGVEIYFRTKRDLEAARPVLEAFTSKGQDGFTMVVDPRAKNDTEFIGVRLQYVPEISARFDEGSRARLMAPGVIEAELADKTDRLDELAREVRRMDGVAHAAVVNYDTIVAGKENYGTFIDSIASGQDSAAGAEVWFGRPVRQGLERAIARYEGQRGQDDAGRVPDAGGGLLDAEGGQARFSRRAEGRNGALEEGAPAGDRRAEQGVGRQPDAGQSQRAPGGRDGSVSASDGLPRYGRPRQGAVSATGYHYSREPRQHLSSLYYGTGLKGQEAVRLAGRENDDIRPRVFFYVDAGNGIRPESGVGGSAHGVQLDNLYDAASDQLGLIKGDPNSWERAIMNAGFDGYLSRDPLSPQHFAVLVGRQHRSVPVVQTQPPAAQDVAPRTAPREDAPSRTTESGGKLTRKPTNKQILDLIRHKGAIQAVAPSYEMKWGNASIDAAEAPAADLVLREGGSTFQFGEPTFSKRQDGLGVQEARAAADEAVDGIRATGTKIGAELARELAANQRVSLVGQTVSSTEDLATLAQVYRDPRFETFRVVFLDGDNRVVSQVGMTSRLPGAAPAVMGPSEEGYFTQLVDAAKSAGASGYYMLHNHPSGKSDASNADVGVTMTYARYTDRIGGMDFRGHVIIDSNEYSVIDRSGDTAKHLHDFGQATPLAAGEWSGYAIGGPADVMSMARKIGADPDAVTLVITDYQMRVRGLATVPASAFSSQAAARRAVTRAALGEFGAQLFAIGRNPSALRSVSDFATDVIQLESDGSATSYRSKSLMQGGRVFPPTRRVRLSPDTSPSFDYLRTADQGGEPGRAAREPDAAYSKRDDVSPLGFYSELARKIESATMTRAPATAWKTFIRALPARGVKPDEITWSGIEDWLDLQEGRVQRQDVVDYLNANGVQVDEAVLGEHWGFLATDGTEMSWPTREEAQQAFDETMSWIDDDSAYIVDRSDSDTPYIEVRGSEGDVFFHASPNEDGEWVRRVEWGDDEEIGSRAAALNDAEDAAYEQREYWRGQVSDEVYVVDGDGAKYARYSLPGGENYREVLLTLPERVISVPKRPSYRAAFEAEMREKYGGQTFPSIYDKLTPSEVEKYEMIVREDRNGEKIDRAASDRAVNYTSDHWDQPNVIAHLRVSDRTDADGRRVLLVDELQSDWGSDGRAKGFVDPGAQERIDAARKAYRDAIRADASEAEQDRLKAALDEATLGARGVIPAAPFVTKTDGWLNLALKRAMTMAVEGGYDAVAFINGQQSADRYNLSKHLDQLLLDGKEDKGQIIGRKAGRQELVKDFTGRQELDDIVGKEIADRLIKSKPNEYGMRSLEGLDLKVGGEGMIAFYDKIVPNAVKALLKKLGGGQMRTIDLADDGLKQPGFDVTDKMRESVADGQPLFSKRAGPKEMNPREDYLVPELDGLFDNTNGAIAQMPEIRFMRDGINRSFPAMPVRIRVGEHEHDGLGVSMQYGAQHRVSNARLKADRGYATPVLDGDPGASEVERAVRDITLGVLASQTAYADNSPTHIFLHAPQLNRSTVLRVQTDSAGKRFWSAVTSVPIAREQMNRRYKAPTSVRVGLPLPDTGLQQPSEPQARMLNLLRAPSSSHVSSESYIVNADGLVMPPQPTVVATGQQPKAPRVLARDANGKIILNKNKVPPAAQQSKRVRRDTNEPMAANDVAGQDQGGAPAGDKPWPAFDVRATAEELAARIRRMGVSVDVTHSGSAAGKSSYLNVSGAASEIRVSDHSKGPFNSQFYVPVFDNESAQRAYQQFSDHFGGEKTDAQLADARDAALKRVKAIAQKAWESIKPKAVREGLKRLEKGKQLSNSNVRALLEDGLLPVDHPQYPNESDAPDSQGVQMSRRTTVGANGRVYTPEQQAMFLNTGRTFDRATLIERVKEFRKDIGKKLAQGIVDQFRPIRDLDSHAYALARLSKGASGAFEALLNFGKLSINDGVYDADQSGGFTETVAKPLGRELDDFVWWVATNRAERLQGQGRENLFTPADIAAGKSLATGQMNHDYTLSNGQVTRDRAAAYADSLKKLDAFNKNVLDIAEQSGLIDGSTRHHWDNEFYVPFYRVSDEDGGFIGDKIKGGLARQRAFKELKGGKDKLHSDLVQNMLQNWAHLIDASAKNRAAKETMEVAVKVGIAVEAGPTVLKQMGRGLGKGPGTAWFMDGGQERHFLIEDPYVLEAINSLSYAGMRGPMMTALSKAKHWLTAGVTASPGFKVRNLIRDSLHAIGTADLSYNPLSNIWDGYKLTRKDNQTYVSALASGGLIRFGTGEASQAERIRKLAKYGVPSDTILDSPEKVKAFYNNHVKKVIDAYQEIGSRGEEINRASLYRQLIAKGVSPSEAALQARDLMDFSMQGTWGTIRFLTQVVPFLNARMQGLYKLGRSAKDDPRRLAIALASTSLASLALFAAYHDDDDWKQREDWDRDGFWWFKIGSTAWRIPRPFEIGSIASVAERGVELFVDDDFTAQRFLDRMKHLASDNLSMNPIPQAIKPVLDVYANKDSFTGRPIESMSMERLQAEYRYNSYTSTLARGASAAMNTVSRGVLGMETLSPVQIDHLTRGYFGWLGTFWVGIADMAVRPTLGEPDRPSRDYKKWITQGFASNLSDAQSKYVTAVYDQAQELDRVQATYRRMVREGKGQDAREFAAENADMLRRQKQVAAVKKIIADSNQRLRDIDRDTRLDSDQKRELVRREKAKQSAAAQRVY